MSTFIDSCKIYVCLQTVHVLEKIVEEKLKKLSALATFLLMIGSKYYTKNNF